MEVRIWTGAELLTAPASPARAGRGLSFALAPRSMAGLLLAAALVPSAGTAVAAQQPTIHLPPNSGGEADGGDELPPDAPSDEDQPEPDQPDAPAPTPAAPEVPPPAASPTPAPPGAEPTPSPPTPAPAPLPGPPQPAADAAPPAPAPAPPAPTPPAPVTASTNGPAAPAHHHRADHARPSAPPRAAGPASAPAARATTVRPAVAPSVPVRVRIDHLRPGGRHAVRPGESLWRIAQALLPAGAPNAAIAAMTARLWALNDSRIGTGSPDELPVGVILHLPSRQL